VFNDLNHEGLESALRRAIGMWFHYPQYWRELMLNGMRHDHSWNHPAQDYLNIYELIREK
jgi:starch synthase